MNFLLLQDEKPVNFFHSLEDAKRAAQSLGMSQDRLRIETYVAPAPSAVWIYDADTQEWIAQT